MHATRMPYSISELKVFNAEMHYIDYILTGKFYKVFFLNNDINVMYAFLGRC